MQRLFDILFSLTGIIFLIPIFIPIIIILRFSGEKEIFFLQERVGFKGEKIKLIKFATMLKDSPNIGTGTVTLKDDNRVLPFGKFLRKTKINELPQILNVLIGQMSLIGPRPQTRRCFNAFPLESQEEIIKIRPGLSGIGSIVFRDEEGIMAQQEDPIRFYDNVLMPYKGLLEVWYVQNNSIFLYFKLIYFTVKRVIFNANVKSEILKYSNLPKIPKDLEEWIL